MSQGDDKDGLDMSDWDDDEEEQRFTRPEPEAAPATGAVPKAPAKPLYQPPKPEDFARPAPQAGGRLDEFDAGFDDDFDDESTRMAEIPEDLIRSIREQAAPATKNETPTEPPPPADEPSGKAELLLDASVDVDVDVNEPEVVIDESRGDAPLFADDGGELDSWIPTGPATTEPASAPITFRPTGPATQPSPDQTVKPGLHSTAPTAAAAAAYIPPHDPLPAHDTLPSAEDDPFASERSTTGTASAHVSAGDSDAPELRFSELPDDLFGDIEDEAPALTLSELPDDLFGDADELSSLLEGAESETLFSDAEPDTESGVADLLASQPPATSLSDADVDGVLGIADTLESDFPPPPDEELVAPAEPARDVGADAARRTVTRRKPRQEHFGLVGNGPDALRSRARLLIELAEGAKESARAGLLVTAAEMLEQLGEADDAHELYVRALEASGTDLVALRALRREALGRGDWSRGAELLRAETNLRLSPVDRELTLTLLAEVELRGLHDPKAAERSARRALEIRPDAVVPNLLLAEAKLAEEDQSTSLAAMAGAADGWNDPRARSTLLADAALGFEAAGLPGRAAELYPRAAEADPGALVPALGLFRARRADGPEAVATLKRLVDGLPPGAARDALRLGLARAAHLMAARPDVALSILDEDGSRGALRVRASAADAMDDDVASRAALEAWASAAGGTERAVALSKLASRLGTAGDLDAADEALRDAALADATVGSVTVLRELQARRAGDTSRLSLAAEDSIEGALGAAAKLACDPAASERERELFVRALHDGDSPVTADTLALDAAASLGDRGAVEASLRRRVERTSPESRVGPLLALADLHRGAGDAAAVTSLLREAAENVPGDPLVTRPLARALAHDHPAEAASLYLEEADVTGDTAGAYAATMAGRALEQAGGDASDAYRKALDILPTYPPAAWALEPLTRRAGDEGALAGIHASMAELAADPAEATGRWVLASRLTSDAAERVKLLENARADSPDDALVYALLLAERPDAAARADLHMECARIASPPAARVARLRAAAAHEEAGRHSEAAALYRGVLESAPDDSVASLCVERAEIAAGEVTRAAERRLAAVKEAGDDEAKIAALEALASLDREFRDDAASATLSLEAILELAPGHIPSLRALETQYMTEERDAALLRIETAMARHLIAPEDIAEHLQLAARLILSPETAGGDAADELLLEVAEHAAFDAGLGRRILGAAWVKGDHARVVAIGKHLAGRLDEPMERASILIETSAAMALSEGAAAAAELLRPAAYGAPEHPLAGAELAKLYESAGDATEAAEAHELAARASLAPGRAASHWHAAGVLWQDKVDDIHRALGALEEVAAIDIAFRDVFERMKTMLTELGKPSRLAELTSARLEAGGEPPVLVELYLTQAEIAEDLGDRASARASLRAALALAPDDLEPMRRLATLSIEDEDWQGAAEALIGLARLLREPDQLRWVFFTLGDLYDLHLPDPRRAEAAFKRVVKLFPEDLEALDRVSGVLVGQGKNDEAVRALTRLAQLEKDPTRGRDARIRLSSVYQSLDKPREAEAVLEAIRRERPTDVPVIEAMVDLYRGQGADSALSMHLNRAVADFRKAIGNDPTDEALWTGMSRILVDKDRNDPARVVAATAVAIGHRPSELASRVDEHGGIPGAGPAAMADELIEPLLPRGLSRAAIEVFRLGGEAFDRALPFDAKAWRATKLGGRDNPLRAEALRVAKWFGVSDVQLLITREAPRVFMPVASSPITLLVGSELPEVTGEPERAFLFARAIHMAVHHLDVAVRNRPEDLALAIAALIHVFDPTYIPEGIEQAPFDEMAKRMSKGVNRKVRDDLSALVREMCGQPGFDPGALGFAAAELGDRAALLALGSPSAAFGALLALGGQSLDGLTIERRASTIRRSGEAWRLLAFAVSELHFDARHTTGADSF